MKQLGLALSAALLLGLTACQDSTSSSPNNPGTVALRGTSSLKKALVEIRDADSTVVGTTTTDSSGAYQINIDTTKIHYPIHVHVKGGNKHLEGLVLCTKDFANGKKVDIDSLSDKVADAVEACVKFKVAGKKGLEHWTACLDTVESISPSDSILPPWLDSTKFPIDSIPQDSGFDCGNHCYHPDDSLIPGPIFNDSGLIPVDIPVFPDSTKIPVDSGKTPKPDSLIVIKPPVKDSGLVIKPPVKDSTWVIKPPYKDSTVVYTDSLLRRAPRKLKSK